MKIDPTQLVKVTCITSIGGSRTTPTLSTASTLYGAGESRFMRLAKEAGQILYRLITLFLNFSAPELEEFVLPEFDREDSRKRVQAVEGRTFLPQIRTKTSPSQGQKGTLVHQLLSFCEHIREQSNKAQGKIQASVQVAVKGQEIPLVIEIDPKSDFKEAIGQMLSHVSRPTLYKGEETFVISLTLESRYLVDKEVGLVQMTTTRKTFQNTCDKTTGDVATTTLQDTSWTNRFLRLRSAQAAFSTPAA